MAGVYVSYPFCAQKCSFCNFASDVGTGQTKGAYEAALLEHVRAHNWCWKPETVYLGGGTPSLMPESVLREVLKAIPGAPWREATLECMPGTVTREKVHNWRAFGINRVSLGVQSFVGEELRLTGRRHSAGTVARDVKLLRAGGITNINLDLIAGLPEQTAESWDRSLDWIEHLDVPHVSIYLFEADEESRLGKELTLGGVRYGAARMPAEDAMAAFYERAVQRLTGHGWLRYEISNFAREGWESHHNLKYWRLEPYVGFGLDAHSYDGVRRWSNPEELTQYLADPRSNGEASVPDPAEEHFFVGLRLMKGIEPTPGEWERFAKPIERWLGAGMLERQGDLLRLSTAGVLVSNEVFQEFLDVA